MSRTRRELLKTGAFAAGGAAPQSQRGPLENLDVFREGDLYKVRGQITGAVLKTAKTADEAIQFAIDSFAGEGGEVALQRGKFVLAKQVNLASRVQLKGSGPGTSLWASDTALLASQCDGAVVADLAVKAGKHGVVLDGCGDCSARNVSCLGLSEHGVWLRNNSFLCEVSGCKLGGVGQSAIFLDNLYRAGRGGDYVPNLVANCIVYGGGVGIECSRAIVANIVACEVFQSAGPGFLVRNTSNSVLISGCRTFQIGGDAVVVENSDEIDISSNIFCWHQGHGIVLRRVIWGAVCGNEVIDTGSPNQPHEVLALPADLEHKVGIWLAEETRGVSVSGNTIFNWPVAPAMKYGILEDAGCHHNIVTSNNINFVREADVLCWGKDTQAANNISYAPEPFRPRRPKLRLQTYNRALMERFIERQR